MAPSQLCGSRAKNPFKATLRDKVRNIPTPVTCIDPPNGTTMQHIENMCTVHKHTHTQRNTPMLRLKVPM